MESLCIVVPKKKAEPVRKKLLEKRILRKDLQIRSDAKNVFFPVSQRIDLGYQIETADFKEAEDSVKDYRTLVDVPEDVRPFLPSSYDVLGTIAVVKMAEEIQPYADEVGRAILATQKSIRTVCIDSGVADQFRTRRIKIVAGEKVTETIHKEYGMTYKLDVSRVFFSPRLATERETVAKQVSPGEIVIDMFAGIGPFALLIAKTRKPKVVYAIDLNPDAIAYMKENMAINKVTNVVPVLGDARAEVAKLEQADRVVMNLPHQASDYLADALKALKPGGIIHYYEILEEKDLADRIERIIMISRSVGRVSNELARRRVKSYSPTMSFYAFDIQFF